MHGLRLALRALWWRRGVSLTILLIATLATAAATLGPLYSRAVEQSVLRDRLQAAPVSTTGVEVGVPTTLAPDDTIEPLLVAVSASMRSLAPGRYFGPVTAQVQTLDRVVVQSPGGGYETRVLWRVDQCAHLLFRAGVCPVEKGQVAVSTAAARRLRAGPATAVSFEFSGLSTAPQAARVVGVYEPRDPDEPYWFDQRLSDGGPDQRIDAIFVSEATARRLPGRIRVSVQSALGPGAVRLDDTDRVRRQLADATTAAAGSPLAPQLSSGLPGVLDRVARERSVIQITLPLVIAQLVLLAWFVLYLVVAGATEERAGEVALVKLRGLRPAAVAAFGLAEPLLLLVLALPLGLLLGYLVTTAFARIALVPGTPVEPRPPVLLALAVALAGGLVAAALAARRSLGEPVLEQLRRVAGTAQSLRRSTAIDAVAVSLAAAGAYQLSGGQLAGDRGPALALLTPGLLAVAVALLGVRLLPLLSRVGVARTRQTGRIAAFLAARQIGRRPRSLRIVVLLTVSVALATFAVDAFQVGGANRASRAEEEIGAARVLRVRPVSATSLMEAVRAADPGGRSAMAVSELNPILSTGTTGRVVAVDATRLAAVASWRESWGETALPELARRLRPPTPPPVVLHGSRVRVSIATLYLALETPLTVTLDLLRGDAHSAVPLGRLSAGSRDYTASVPCSAGCRLLGLRLERGLAKFGPITGAITVRAIRMEGAGAMPVDAGLAGESWRLPERWRVPLGNLSDPSATPPLKAYATPAGLVMEFTDQVSYVPEVELADAPFPLPAVLAADTPRTPYPGLRAAVYATGLDGEPTLVEDVAITAVLPRAGRSGVLVDLAYADRLAGTGDRYTDEEVWIAAGAPADIVRRLAEAGLTVTSTETVGQRRAVLDRQGPALALLLFLVAAAAALALALVAVAVAVYTGGRRRAYELAAMRTFGVSRRTLVRAVAREQVLLLGAGVVFGVAAGLGAAMLALPAVPVFPEGDVGPPLDFAPAWPALGLLVVAALGLAALVAHLTARVLVWASLPDRLREAAA